MDDMVSAAAPEARKARKPRRDNNLKPVGVPFILRSIPTYDILSDENLIKIEKTSDRILSEVGIEFRDDPTSLEHWKRAGAKIEGVLVRFEPGMLNEIVRSAPARFTQHARNPARNVEIGGKNVVFSPAYGSPFVMDIDKGRRYGTLEDFQNFIKLAYSSPWLHHSGGTICEPVDVPVNKRHLDMVYSSPTFGTPEPAIGSMVIGQLARRLNLPLRCAGNFSNSKLPDAQAMQEGLMSMLSAVHCGANFILHSAGFLDGLLAMSYEKFVMDTDLCGALHSYLAGVVVDDNTLAMDAFLQVGPGSHFLGSDHTMRNYQTAFWDSTLSDNEPFEKWSEEGGSTDMATRANRQWKKTLAEYEAPKLDEAVDEALVDYMTTKKKNMPDAWY